MNAPSLRPCFGYNSNSDFIQIHQLKNRLKRLIEVAAPRKDDELYKPQSVGKVMANTSWK